MEGHIQSFSKYFFGDGWYFNAAKNPCNDEPIWKSYDCFDTMVIECQYNDYLKSNHDVE